MRQRMAHQSELKMAAEAASDEYDTKRIARKALNQLTYECRIRAMAT